MFAKYAGASSVSKAKALGTFESLKDSKKTVKLA
jgi:hypothetical protein